MPTFAKQGSTILSGFLSLVGDGEQKLASSAFSGTWLVEDVNGETFEITLFGSGAAEANSASEGVSGSWTESDDGLSAIINWDTGWTTKITRTGDGHVKTAYDATATAPVSTSAAKRI